MTLDDVKEWKKKLLTPIQERIGARAVIEGAAALRPETRLAVGYSRQTDARLCLEIRTQKKAGPAWNKAQELKSQYPGDVNIAVIESVQVSPIKDVLELQPFSTVFTTRPLCLGSSVSHEDETAPGSLGAFVLNGEGDPSFLSCSHVLALSGQVNERMRVTHPGVGDVVGALRSGHFIGTVSDYTATTQGRANALDAAHARLKGAIPHNGNVIPDQAGAPPGIVGQAVTYNPAALGLLQADAILAKVGRTTGYTFGHLNAIGVDNVPVLVHGIGLVYFDNCIEVRWRAVNRPFTRPGDSGAAVFTEAREAIGLHFAAGDANRDGRDLKISYACDLTTIMDAALFNLTWLP